MEVELFNLPVECCEVKANAGSRRQRLGMEWTLGPLFTLSITLLTGKGSRGKNKTRDEYRKTAERNRMAAHHVDADELRRCWIMFPDLNIWQAR